MILVPLLFGLAFSAPEFACTVPKFHDGDNIRCGNKTMRIAGIDAPELAGSPRCHPARGKSWCDDALARQSRDHLEQLGDSGPVRCRAVAPPDRYGRPIVRCRVNGVDLGEAQLQGGYAKRWP